ncbi:SRPBCC family protein [Chryseobacterium sp. OSA05B]|uniref:SRPBCC family protein n=1 Tax=Chryseobacterium sp. OSA05B TaxID=2862650 RepID=UPI001CBD7D4C|nr:SRPBCC family protein [Chryseobacterium sp. OSA05B]
MTTIYLETPIKANIHKVFDLARDIDLHQKSTGKTNEKAVGGRTSGLIEENETVTWRARHLGIYQTLTTKIISMEKPVQFTDIMLKGAFKTMKHKHIFKERNGSTVMIDVFEFKSPFGIVGRFFNHVFLKDYMRKFLLERNELIKNEAESVNM